MTLMSEFEMAQAVEKICDGVTDCLNESMACDMERFFDGRTEQASIAELYEICRRVQYRCSANDIVLVKCDEDFEDARPWKVEYKVQPKEHSNLD